MNRRKLCLVIPSLQAGGMERVMSELAQYFTTLAGNEVHLVLYGISREIFYPVNGNTIVHTPRFKFNNNWRLFYTLKTLFYLRRTIRRINPFSILSFGEYWNNFLLLSTFGLNFPVFVSDRSQPDKSLGWFQDTLRRQLYPRARGLIFQTEKAKEIFLMKNKHPNVIVIGNPVRLFADCQIPLNRENIVLMVGRLIKSKHQDKLIEMFASIDNPDWKLLLVGYDHLKQNNMERLKELANTLKVEDKVIFTGKKYEVEEIYLNSSVFAFTSSSEGFPNAIGEAMSAGLPVVAFDCVAGPAEMISDGYNGFLVPDSDFSLFQTRLNQLMKDKELRSRLGSNARKSITRFSHDNICEAFYRFITDIKHSEK